LGSDYICSYSKISNNTEIGKFLIATYS